MGSPSKGLGKVEVAVKWDASAMGEPDHDVDIIAATYAADAPHGAPVYLVHFDSRSPDGTITLSRDSTTGQGFGYDEVMTFELERLASTYARVVVGVAIQQRTGRRTFADIPSTRFRVAEGYTELAQGDFAAVAGATAAVIGEFVRDGAGEWGLRPALRGFDTDPAEFTRVMGDAGA
ncbi:TerD family protein [Streptomyces avicenniae]|uniref:TerD family protein n=1 Tax=Streptomyces avicenniae TaxID=500153 RepID=UPI00069AA75F|nr:TerD family protein [Streptomyces avicenniae]